MRISYSLFIILLSIARLDVLGQWTQCKGDFAHYQVQKFAVFDSFLIAGCREGSVIYYNNVNNTWDQKVETGMVVDLATYKSNVYVLNAANQIKSISSSKEVKEIDFPIEKFGIRSLQQIFVSNNILYLGCYKGVFYQSFGDTLWFQMNSLKDGVFPVGVINIIEFQGKIVVLANNGIYISTNGKTFERHIKNEDILSFGATSKKLLQQNEINSYKLKNIVCNENSLYTYSGMEIYTTKDLINWQRNKCDSEILHIKPICCNGIIINAFKLYYSFNLSKWNEIPSNKLESSTPMLASIIFIFHNKIFAGVIDRLDESQRNGIWSLPFNYSLQF
jgi:hypothetical protein